MSDPFEIIVEANLQTKFDRIIAKFLIVPFGQTDSFVLMALLVFNHH